MKMLKLSRNFLVIVFFLVTSFQYCVVFAENTRDKSISDNLANVQISDEEILNKIPEIEKVIASGLKKIKIPGATLAISRKDKVLYCKAFGKTAISGYQPKDADAQTLFSVSSVSKNITAVLVGALVDDGKISFTDKVRKYYPEFFLCNEAISNEFTIQDLISHSSGLKHFSADTLFKAGYDNEKILRAFRYLKQKPGEFRKFYGYQNIVYGIVGIVLERATGEKYEDLVQRYIFDKMGMKNSSAIRLDAETSKIGYLKYLISRFSYDCKHQGVLKTCWNLIAKTISHKTKKVADIHSKYIDDVVHLDHNDFYHKFPATSGISLSAEDFAKWLNMLANQGTYNGVQIVSKETFAKLISNIVTVKGIKDHDVTFVKSRYPREDMHYGMGFFNAKYADDGKNPHRIFFHMGGIRGSTAFFALSLADNIAVGVSCNLGGVAMTRFCEYAVHAVLDRIYDFSKIDWVEEDIKSINYYREKNKNYIENVVKRTPVAMSKPDKYTGTYTSELYGDITIALEGDELVISNGIRKAKLSNVNGDTFAFKSMDLMYSFYEQDEYVYFIRDEYGNITSCELPCFNENNTIFKKK